MWGNRVKAPWDRRRWVGVGHGGCMAVPRGDPALRREHGGVGAAGLRLAVVWLQRCDPGFQTCCRALRESRAAAAFLLLLLLLLVPPMLPFPPAAGLVGLGQGCRGGLHVVSHSWAMLETAAFRAVLEAAELPVAPWLPRSCSGTARHGTGLVMPWCWVCAKSQGTSSLSSGA